MTAGLRHIGQAAVLALFAAFLGYFATGPAYTAFPSDRALIKLSFSHGGGPITECRRLTSAELAKLPPNMRRPTQCPRERVPLVIELLLDNEVLVRGARPPTGLSGDGPSRVYERFVVAPGPHRLVVRLRDTARGDGFDHEYAADISLRPQQSMAIDFRPETGGFVLR
jgi:hypothetical protein